MSACLTWGHPKWGPPEVRRGGRQEVKALDGERRAGCFPRDKDCSALCLRPSSSAGWGRVGVGQRRGHVEGLMLCSLEGI